MPSPHTKCKWWRWIYMTRKFGYTNLLSGDFMLTINAYVSYCENDVYLCVYLFTYLYFVFVYRLRNSMSNGSLMLNDSHMSSVRMDSLHRGPVMRKAFPWCRCAKKSTGIVYPVNLISLLIVVCSFAFGSSELGHIGGYSSSVNNCFYSPL